MGLHFLDLNLLPVEDASSQSSCSPSSIKHLPQLHVSLLNAALCPTQ